MDENNTIMVSVPIKRYQELIENEVKLNLLTNTLLGTARLNYNKKGFVFSDDTIDVVLNAIYPYDHATLVARLQEEAAKKEES